MYPTLLKIGGFHLMAHGTFIALALLAGGWLAGREASRRGIPSDCVYGFIVWATLLGLLGARLYHLALAAPGSFVSDPLGVLAVWRGGLAIHGALLSGAATAIWYARRHHLSFWRLTDTLAPAVILGQAIGRFGSFLDGDAYGAPAMLPWAVTFTNPEALAPLGVPLHPTQLYEMGLSLVLFGLLWWWRTRIRFDGQLFLLYTGGYGIVLIIVENFRGDRLWYGGGVSADQALGVLILITVATLYALRGRSATMTPGELRNG